MTEKKKASKEEKAGKKKETPKAKKLPLHSTGKRKRSVARAVVRKGSGKIKINYNLIENETNEVYRLRVMEPLIVSGADWKKYDFIINVKGGGVMGQASAARQAIGKALVEIFGSGIREKLMDYDRNMLAYDPRRTEPHKPPRSSQGARRYKQRSKR